MNVMEATKLKTIENLKAAWLEDERLELINGEIVKRPMARSEHGITQGNIGRELDPYTRKGGTDQGWWIMTEIGVRYNEYQCPTHDIAGSRKERIAQRPTGIMELIPDWVCEITSPGHEKKDTFHNFLLLQKYEVPYYWIIWPEDEALIAYKLVESRYHVIETIEGSGKVRIEPFAEIEFDLDYVFGNG